MEVKADDPAAKLFPEQDHVRVAVDPIRLQRGRAVVRIRGTSQVVGIEPDNVGPADGYHWARGFITERSAEPGALYGKRYFCRVAIDGALVDVPVGLHSRNLLPA